MMTDTLKKDRQFFSSLEIKKRHEIIVGSMGKGINALSLVRALGRVGVPVHLIIPAGTDNWAAWSKYCVSTTRLETFTGEHCIRALKEVAEKCSQRPVFYADNDLMLHYVVEESDIDKWVLLTSLPEQSKKLLDKKYQVSVADKAGLPVPNSWFPKSWDEIAAIDSPGHKRLIAKKRFPVAGERDTFKVLSAADGASLCGKLKKKCLDPSELFVQEFVAGDDTTVYFSLSYSALHLSAPAIVTGRKLIQSGSGDGGIMILGQALQNDSIRSLTEKFIHYLGYHGYFGVEFKYCEQEDTFYFIEVNARPERCNALARAAGVDLDVISYLDVCGMSDQLQQVNLTPRPGVWLDGQKIVETLRRRRNLYDFKQLFKVLGPKKEWAVFAGDDMQPFWRSLSWR